MTVTTTHRSQIMRAVKGKNTEPEMVVRRSVHRMGYRFRLHCLDLPGRPDLVFPRLHKVLFVNGCFWHGHDCARGARVPKTNRAYWQKKVAGNRARDKKSLGRLTSARWDCLVVWECELRSDSLLQVRLREFLAK